ncbi:MAG: peptidoglycan editing factor PgeF [Candidatus Sumerlaeaceae bacterium]
MESPAGGDITLNDEKLIAQAPPLLQFPWLNHGCTTRHFSPPDANRADELQHLRRSLALPEDTPILHAEQKHTSRVAVFRPEDLRQLTTDHRHVYRMSDGIISAHPGVMLAILTADCAAIFLADKRIHAIGLVHAGWKGTLGRIAEHAVGAMIREGSNAADVVAWIGPMIGACCYEVSPEMVEQFAAEFRDAADAGIQFTYGRHLDLVALNAYQLRIAGIPAANIHRSGVCTQHQKNTYYSFRGDLGTTGRIISALYCEPQP